jgi:hypothetical protein
MRGTVSRYQTFWKFKRAPKMRVLSSQVRVPYQTSVTNLKRVILSASLFIRFVQQPCTIAVRS